MARPRKSPRGAASPRVLAASAASAVPPEDAERHGGAANKCRNPFCGSALDNRVAKYCEDRPNCQRYRVVMMHCAFRRVLEHAGAPLPAGEARSVVQSADGDRNGDGDAAFSIPRRKRKAAVESGGVGDQRGLGVEAVGRQKKRKTKSQKTPEGVTVTSTSSRLTSPAVGQDALPTEMRMRQRLIQRHVETAGPTDDAVHLEVESATANATDANSPAAGRAATAAQAVKQMDIELVPLGMSRQAVNFAGGGRYVQSGNRTAGPTLPPPPTTVRPPLPPKPPTNSVGTAPSVSVSAQAVNSARTVPHQSFTAGAQVSRPSGTSGTPGIRSASVRTTSASSSAPLTTVADNSSSRQSSMRISASDYLSARKVQEAAPSSRTSPKSKPLRSSAASHIPAPKQHQPSRDYLSDEPDYSYSDWDHSAGYESVPPAAPPTANRANYQREPQDRPPLGRGMSHSEDRTKLSSPLGSRPDYRRSHSDTSTQSSHRDDRYVHRQSSAADAFREFHTYPEERVREPPRNRSADDRAHADEIYQKSRDFNRRSPRGEHFEERFRQDRPLPSESTGGARSGVDAFGHREERDHSRNHPAAGLSAASPSSSETHDRRNLSAAPTSNGHGAGSSSSSSATTSLYDIEPPQFSYHDKFVSDLLSVFIRDIPHAIGAVKNKTKKPRKLKWYLDYVERAAKLFGSDTSIGIVDNTAVMLVRQREWFTMKDPSTTMLYTRVLHRLVAEALMWRHIREEAEQRFKMATATYGSNANMGIVFIQMWNELKTHTSREFISLEKQVRYFCGARKHHWSFSVGNVEIGSGSHEDKRTAFNFATAASMNFIMQLHRPQTERRWEDSSRMMTQDRSASEGDDRRHDLSSVAAGRGRSSGHGRSSDRGRSTEHDQSPGHIRSTDHGRSEPDGDHTSDLSSEVATDAGDAQTPRGVPGQGTAAESPPHNRPLNSTDNNNAGAAVVVAAVDTIDIPGRLLDPRLRRPLTDPRIRRPSLADPRTNGPMSTLRTHGPAAELRAGASSNPKTQGPLSDPRTRATLSDKATPPVPVVAPTAASNGGNAGESDAGGAHARTVAVSEDEMSISEESDPETRGQAHAKPPTKPAPKVQDTTCHFCAMIRLSKPDAVDAKCFRCQAKAVPSTL